MSCSNCLTCQSVFRFSSFFLTLKAQFNEHAQILTKHVRKITESDQHKYSFKTNTFHNFVLIYAEREDTQFLFLFTQLLKSNRSEFRIKYAKAICIKIEKQKSAIVESLILIGQTIIGEKLKNQYQPKLKITYSQSLV